jgi:hypothetical protein
MLWIQITRIFPYLRPGSALMFLNLLLNIYLEELKIVIKIYYDLFSY